MSHSQTAAEFTANQHALSDWQAQRLASTYADLQADPRYAPATTFFLSDLYGPYDTSARDHDGERVIHIMDRILPKSAMLSLHHALELNAQTKALDLRLEKMLFEEMEVSSVDAAHYAEAFRRCDNYAERLAQIETIEELGQLLDRVVHKPLVNTALKLAHGPAHMAGFGALQDFLERGFAAFRHMKSADEFLATIKRRELIILERIYAGESDPFSNVL